MSELSRLSSHDAGIYAINPNSLMDDGLMISYHDHDTSLGETEQLYTARGSQGFGTYDEITEYGVDPSNY